MEATQPRATKIELSIGLGLFVLALLPRVFGLGSFITSDEPLWLTRSIAFAGALFHGNWANTLQTGHPGVTTMWSGTLGLAGHYLWQQSPLTWADFLQTLSLDPENIDISLLPWVRLPTVILAAASVSIIYHWSRRLVGSTAALVGALLLAFEPLFLAHSRTLHHDALATIFIAVSLVMLFNYAHPAHSRRRYLLASAMMAGLALLSKGTALVLVGFTGLFFGWLWIFRGWSLRRVVGAGGGWLAGALMVFVAVWPAMWVVPGQALSEVFGWVLASADVTDLAETASPVWQGRVPELGILFYPVNWLLKSTGLTLLGLGAAIGWWRQPTHRSQRWVMAWWGLFAVLFTLLLTAGDKRDGRYLLPIYPGLALISGAGLTWLAGRLKARLPLKPTAAKIGGGAMLIGTLAAFSLPWYPYYHSYYNPILGGSYLAPRLVKVGWGEGMEQAAAWLNQQPNAETLVVATSYASTLRPFLAGNTVKHHEIAPSDYILNYSRQIQNGYPFPEYWDYYQPRPPIFTVQQNGLQYVWLYPGPHITIVRNAEFAKGLTLLGFVGKQDALQPGQSTPLTLLWRVPANTNVDHQTAQLRLQTGDGHIWATAQGSVLDPAGPSPVEGHYWFDIPADTPRGNYELWVTVGQVSHLAGTIPVRQMTPPPASIPLSANFGNLITLAGADVALDDTGQKIDIRLVWQAKQPMSLSYTTFVHALDPAGQVQGQVDRIPGDGRWPTNTWAKGEWITDSFSLPLNPDQPPTELAVVVGLYDFQTLERLPVLGGDEGQTVIYLTTIKTQ